MTSQGTSARLPRRLLCNLAWEFVGHFDSSRAFVRALRDNHREIIGGEFDPDEVVFPGHELIACVVDEAERVHEVVVRSSDGGPLRASELMFRLHRALESFPDLRHRFFEGLIQERGVRYRLNLGS